MVTPQIVDYIKNTLSQGYSEDKIRAALLRKGWSQADVDEGFRIAKGIPSTVKQTLAATPAVVQTSPAPTSAPQQPALGSQAPSQPAMAAAASALPTVRQEAPVLRPVVASQPPIQPTPAAAAIPVAQPTRQEVPLAKPVQSSPIIPPAVLPVMPIAAAQVRPAQPPIPAQTMLPPKPTQPPVAAAVPPPVQAAPASVPSRVLPPQSRPIVPEQKPLAPQSSVMRSGEPMQPEDAAVRRPIYPTAPVAKPVEAIMAPATDHSQTPGGVVAGSILEEDTPRLSIARLIGYIVGGLVVIAAVYVFVGMKYGLYVAGYDLFPFKKSISSIALKIGIIKVSPTPLPPPVSPRPSVPAPTPTPLQTPTPTPAPQVAITTLGSASEAGLIGVADLSADGEFIAYALLTDERNLWTMNTDDGKTINLSTNGIAGVAQGEQFSSLAWSPMGNTAAAITRDALGVGRLYIIDAALNTARRVPTDAISPSFIIHTNAKLAWNDQGTELLMHAENAIWKVVADTLALTRITPTLAFGSFDWSAKSGKIAYTLIKKEAELIWVMDGDGKNYRQLTFGGISQAPSFDPMTGDIAYIERTIQGSETLKRASLTKGTLTDIVTFDGAVREFVWSPDGNYIAAITRPVKGPQQLWLVNAASGKKMEILQDADSEPVGWLLWDPNGKSVFFAGKTKFIIKADLTETLKNL